MRKNRFDILKSSSGVALATFCSRILGLVRAMLEAWVLGGGALATAWELALMAPNLCRRILGEGALAQALIPLLTHTEAKRDTATMRRQLGVVFCVLGVLLALIVVVVSGGAILLRPWITTDYGRMAMTLIPVVMPYAFFICLIGIIGAFLNTRRIFFLPALGALAFNVFLIAVLYGAYYFRCADGARLLEALGFAVLLSGAVQLALMIFLLWRSRCMPLFDRGLRSEVGVLRDLWRLVLPGLIGASAIQVSFLVDRTLAAFLGPYAVPALNYTERIVYVPLGVFATALSAVLLADMSRAAAHEQFAELLDDMNLGLRYVFFLCLPLAVFFIVFREEILRLLFLRGSFTETNLKETGWAMMFYSLGIPTFCATKIILPAFYARKDMATPLKMSLIAISCNVVLNLLLMFPMRQGGIALATVMSSLINNSLLLLALRRSGLELHWLPVVKAFLKTSVASLLAVSVYFAYHWLQMRLAVGWLPKDLLPLVFCGSVFALVYLLLNYLFKSEELPELLGTFRRRKGPKEAPAGH